MIVYIQQICNISAYNIHVCETIVDQDQQRLQQIAFCSEHLLFCLVAFVYSSSQTCYVMVFNIEGVLCNWVW